MNFAYGFASLPQDFDVNNNAYVEFDAYIFESSDAGGPPLLKKVEGTELELCDHKKLKNWIKSNSLEMFYNKALCLKDPKNLSLKGNWHKAHWRMLAFTMSECRPVNGKVCKSSEEIREWIAKHPTFFVAQHTHFQPDMFASHKEYMNNWPNIGKSVDDYMPVTVSHKSIDYGPILTPDIALKNKLLPVVELFYGFHNASFKDEPYPWSPKREKQFLNIDAERTLIEDSTAFRFEKPDEIPKKFLKYYSIGLTNDHVYYKRRVITLVDIISKVGGLQAPMIVFVTMLSGYYA